MGYFQVRYDTRVVIYERKLFIRLATGLPLIMRGLLQDSRLVPSSNQCINTLSNPSDDYDERHIYFGKTFTQSILRGVISRRLGYLIHENVFFTYKTTILRGVFCPSVNAT